MNGFKRNLGATKILSRTTAFAVVCVIVSTASTLISSGEQVTTQSRPIAITRDSDDVFIPPATPLVACDPYFSVWSFADELTDDTTRHWTGTPQGITCLIRIDDQTYRIMGNSPEDLPALTQTDLKILPTRTVCEFNGAGVSVNLTFLTAALPHNLDILSRPVTYLVWNVNATDSKEHRVSIYFENEATLAVNQPTQKVNWSKMELEGLSVTRIGSQNQPILAKKGDDLRIDWGYIYSAAATTDTTFHNIGAQDALRADFIKHNQLPSETDARRPRAANDDTPAAAFVFDLGDVDNKQVERKLILAYDDLYSIQYFERNLRPYWRRNGADAEDLITKAFNDFTQLRRQCAEFDQNLMHDLTRAGGIDYANLCALAYRQCLAANKLVADANGQPMLFSKECFSNGCIGTVDVIYPMSPMVLFLSPTLTKAMLAPVLNYARSERWTFPFAPHDLGTYPLANGQAYGGGEHSAENQMPVEESANMLLMISALAEAEGNTDFAAEYWPTLLKWAEFLEEKGYDPENQLCTDDFAGHLAHNVNLSAKAINALGAFSRLCTGLGKHDLARKYNRLAAGFSKKWAKEADDGDHFRLAFDKSGTWSQKYNLVWDQILGLNLFTDDIRNKEMAFYKKVQNRYGLPLDNRSKYTKLDWVLWTATLTEKREDFKALLDPVMLFLRETSDRVPMTDWYWTHNAKRVGFQARPVVGGVFLKMLYNKNLWKEWAGRDNIKASNWAPVPKPPKIITIIPYARDQGVTWKYTTTRPAEDWYSIGFNDSGWQTGKAGFGTPATPGATIGTRWDTSDIWIRRSFDPAQPIPEDLKLYIHHDEDAQVFINGTPVAEFTGFTTDYMFHPLNDEIVAELKPSGNIIAIHCKQTSGGQYIDAGLVRVEYPEE
ncbi:MAG: DUF4965 domain-containing protein [Verrucomicrobia bacterium]|nr:DUF4965 domain-containing protein [Verrucomicrobiota bacterium]MCF7707599.1 DUF4965 domain-containing protein [Verrucomicrobiota bacterium]